MRASLVLASLFALTSAGVYAATTSVDSIWTDNFTVTTPITTSLGVPLSPGGGADGDGAVLQIGYFASVPVGLDPADYTPADWASFVALTGDDSKNPGFATTIGDGGAPGGFYTLGVTFDDDTHSDLPTVPSRVGIRYFDGLTVAASSESNIVTSFHGDWIISPPSIGSTPAAASLDARVPSTPSPPHAPGLVWEQGDASAFKVVPEPSSTLLGLSAGLLLCLRRRR